MKCRTLWIVIAFVALVGAVTVWPTLYRYSGDGATRTNRITGSSEIRMGREWRPVYLFEK